jgi:hypothetical protein
MAASDGAGHDPRVALYWQSTATEADEAASIVSRRYPTTTTAALKDSDLRQKHAQTLAPFGRNMLRGAPRRTFKLGPSLA